jgi:hypothetical protein
VEQRQAVQNLQSLTPDVRSQGHEGLKHGRIALEET